MKKNRFHPLGKLPEVCETCGQKIDHNSPGSIARHATARHLPYLGKAEDGWLALSLLGPCFIENPNRGNPSNIIAAFSLRGSQN